MITSATNEKVKNWCKLHQKKYRDAESSFLVEEDHLIQEALKCNLVREIISLEQYQFDFDNVSYVSQNVLNKISKNVSDAHFIAVCRFPDEKYDLTNRILMLDNIQDPGNLGTILRSACAFGFKTVYLSSDCCDVYNDKCIRSSQGAIFQLNIIKGDLVNYVDELKGLGYQVYATSLKNAVDINELERSDKMVFIFGNEGQGVRQELIDMATSSIIIPINDFESLNVGVAAGIVMYLYRG